MKKLAPLFATAKIHEKALKMIKGAYMSEHENHLLSFEGTTIKYDSKTSFIQSIFDANPEYSAFASRPSNSTSYKKPDFPFDEAKSAFNTFASSILAIASQSFIGKKENIPDSFRGYRNDEDFYSNGYPPEGPKIEERLTPPKHKNWKDFVAGKENFGIV